MPRWVRAGNKKTRRIPMDTAGLFSGASRDRTGDPLLAKQVLSQLSYGPSESEFREVGTLLVGFGAGTARSLLASVGGMIVSLYRPPLKELPCQIQ